MSVFILLFLIFVCTAVCIISYGLYYNREIDKPPHFSIPALLLILIIWLLLSMQMKWEIVDEGLVPVTTIGLRSHIVIRDCNSRLRIIDINDNYNPNPKENEIFYYEIYKDGPYLGLMYPQTYQIMRMPDDINNDLKVLSLKQHNDGDTL